MKDDEEAMVMAGRSRWGDGVQGKRSGRWSFDVDVKEGYLSPKLKVLKLEAEYSEDCVEVGAGSNSEVATIMPTLGVVSRDWVVICYSL